MRWLVMFLVAAFALCMVGQQAGASVILGTGTAALLKGDLTDPENNGSKSGNIGLNFNANFRSTDEPGFGGGEFSFNVFDNAVGGGNAKWCCNAVDADGHQLDAQLHAGQHILTHFTMTSSNDTPARDPLDWSILGSNDGVNWTTIYANGGASVWTARNQVVRFDMGTDYAAPTAYSWYRYDVRRTGTNAHALNEIEYFGYPAPEPATLSLLGVGALALLRRRRKS